MVFITDGYSHVFRCDMVLRFLPFVFGNLSMIVFYFVCKKLFESKWSILAGMAFIAMNPVLINYCFEFKPYSLDVFASLVAILVFYSIDFNRNNLKQIFLYGFILAILPWFSFGCAFVIAAGFLALSFKKESPKLFIYLLSLPIISGFIYLNLFVSKSYSQNSNGMLGFWHDYFVKSDFSNIYQLVIDNFNYFFSNVPHFSFFIAAIAIIVGFVIFIKKSEILFVQITTLTFATLIFASVLKYYPFSRRMIIFLIPIIILYLVKITDIKKWCLGALILTFLLIPHFIFAYDFLTLPNLNKGDFSREMMFIMSKHIANYDTVVISEGSNTDFFYYNNFFRLQNKIEFLKPDKTRQETNTKLLNNLRKGSYWIFASYDYSPQFVNNKEIKIWAKSNSEVEFEVSATQSTLMRVIIH